MHDVCNVVRLPRKGQRVHHRCSAASNGHLLGYRCEAGVNWWLVVDGKKIAGMPYLLGFCPWCGRVLP